MTKPSTAEKAIGHIAKFAVFHPVILDWFEDQRLLYPEARDLAVACVLAAGQAGRPPKEPVYTYKIHRSMIESWNRAYANDQTEAMPYGMFETIVGSLHEDAGFRRTVGKVLHMREFGEVGDYRQHLFETGFRDPQLSAIMCERFPHLDI